MAEQSLPIVSSNLPGTPFAYYLGRGHGDKYVVFDQLFTLLVEGAETDGQYDMFENIGHAGDAVPPHLHPRTHETFFVQEGACRLWMDDQNGNVTDRVLTAGEFGFVPANVIHSYRLEATSRLVGSSTGGFSGFFRAIGKATDTYAIPTPEQIHAPSIETMIAAGQEFGTTFLPDYSFA
ncbi:MAG: quercetin 2,3-dioxygenase [Pseudoclavibacter sp.]